MFAFSSVNFSSISSWIKDGARSMSYKLLVSPGIPLYLIATHSQEEHFLTVVGQVPQTNVIDNVSNQKSNILYSNFEKLKSYLLNES